MSKVINYQQPLECLSNIHTAKEIDLYAAKCTIDIY